MTGDEKWLANVLNANGLSLDDVLSTLNIHPGNWTKEQWNEIMSYLNDLPSLDYPSESIVDDIDELIAEQGTQAMVIVSYGVNAGQLIFTGFEDATNQRYYGSPASPKTTAHFPLTLAQARTLFFKQNCTLKQSQQ